MKMNKVTKFLIAVSMLVTTAFGINMTQITDAINITWAILQNIIDNTGVIIGFIVLIFVIGLIGFLLLFVKKLLTNLIDHVGKGGNVGKGGKGGY